MTVRSIGCAACGAEVPHGRLSCPACGELLASVSGGVRPAVAEVPAARAMPPVLHDVPEPSVTAAVDPQPVPTWHPEPPVAGPPLPGAYLPPATLATPAGVLMAAGPAAPARAWAGASAAADLDPSPDVASSPADDALRARARESIGWIAVAGCAVSGLGFLVPWARTMIGSGGDGYVDQWGLAGPGHLLVIVALAILGALTVLAADRVPPWLRLGLPGLALGSLIVGLVWPYLFGPLGTLPGAYLSLVGALMLVGAAVATLVIDRHEGAGSPV